MPMVCRGGGGNVEVPSLSVHYEHRIVDENQFYFVLIKNLCMSYTSQFLPYACLSFYSPTQSLCLSRFFFTSKTDRKDCNSILSFLLVFSDIFLVMHR